MKDKTAVERNRRLREKLVRDGLVLVQVRVPRARRDDILTIAREMCYEKMQLKHD